MNIKEDCNTLRGNILFIDEQVLSLARQIKQQALSNHESPGDVGEMIANAMLAHRHLEDARMRLGKVIQALEGGVSCYDRIEPPAPVSMSNPPTDDAPLPRYLADPHPAEPQ